MMMFEQLLQLILLPLGISLLVLGCMLLNQSVRFPRGVQRNCWCGRCGYEIRSLDQQICPECGEAHVIAGVITPGLLIRVRGSMFTLVMGWTLVYGLLAGMSLYPVTAIISSGAMSSRSIRTIDVAGSIRPQDDMSILRERSIAGMPRQGDRYQIRYAASVKMRGTHLSEGSVILEIEQSGIELEIDLVDSSWVLTDQAHLADDRGGRFSAGVIGELFDAAGLENADTKATSEITAIADYISNMLDDPTKIDSHVSRQDPIWVSLNSSSYGNIPIAAFSVFGLYEAVLLAFIVGYAVGLIIMIRKRAGLLRQSAIS